jgi:exodeoxyribonuclease III
MEASGLSLLTFNIGNPSEERARRQLDWLAGRDEHVLVLTETKASSGCQFLAGAFAAAGYHVTFPVPEPGEYGVMIASRVRADSLAFGDSIGYLPARAAAATLPTPDGPVQVIGAYVPSRDAGLEKTERKQKWLAACSAALAARDRAVPAVFLGDLNILEPGHRPHYSFFAPFEYDFYRALSADYGFVDASGSCIPMRSSTAGLAGLVTATATITRSAPLPWPPPSPTAGTCTSHAKTGCQITRR